MILHYSENADAEIAGKDSAGSPDNSSMYPCYKSFDGFIDVESLKALDTYIAQRIIRHIAKKDEEYFLNAHRLHEDSPHQPGAREIWLTRPVAGRSEVAGEYQGYQELDAVERWQETPAALEFSLLMNFIRTLPFTNTGRMIIIYDDAATSVPAHRDHLDVDVCQEFVWFRTNLRKPFYMLNHQTGRKVHVDSYSAWFDSVNQFHGTDAALGLSFSVRVDGHFTEDLKQLMPTCDSNRASIPALWSRASEAAV